MTVLYVNSIKIKQSLNTDIHQGGNGNFIRNRAISAKIGLAEFLRGLAFSFMKWKIKEK